MSPPLHCMNDSQEFLLMVLVLSLCLCQLPTCVGHIPQSQARIPILGYHWTNPNTATVCMRVEHHVRVWILQGSCLHQSQL